MAPAEENEPKPTGDIKTEASAPDPSSGQHKHHLDVSDGKFSGANDSRFKSYLGGGEGGSIYSVIPDPEKGVPASTETKK